MYCNQCGHDNSQDINFCSGCGRPIGKAGEPEAETGPETETKPGMAAQADTPSQTGAAFQTGIPAQNAEPVTAVPVENSGTTSVQEAGARQESGRYVFKAKRLARHTLGIVIIVFYGITIIPAIIAPMFQISSVSFASIAFSIFILLIFIGVIVLFSLLIYGSLKKVITIDEQKIEVKTPFRTRSVPWSDIVEVVHFTQKINGITTGKAYQFNNSNGKILFAMPEKGDRMFKGNGSMTDALFHFYDKQRKSRIAAAKAIAPVSGQSPQAPVSGLNISQAPAPPTVTQENFKDVEFKSGIARKINMIGLSAFISVMLVASMTTATSEQSGIAIVFGVAFVLLVDYLILMNATARLTVTKDSIRYKNMFRKEELVISFASIYKITDDNFYFFHYLELDTIGGKRNLKGLRFHNIKRITSLISQRVQLYRS